MIDNLYETIGGKRTIQAATDAFYRRVLEDKLSVTFSIPPTWLTFARGRACLFPC